MSKIYIDPLNLGTPVLIDTKDFSQCDQFNDDSCGEMNPHYGKKHSAGARKKMVEASKRRWTDEAKKSWAIQRSGKGNPMYGKLNKRGNHTEETKKKISEAFKGRKREGTRGKWLAKII